MAVRATEKEKPCCYTCRQFGIQSAFENFPRHICLKERRTFANSCQDTFRQANQVIYCKDYQSISGPRGENLVRSPAVQVPLRDE